MRTLLITTDRKNAVDGEWASFATLRREFGTGVILRRLFRYDEVVVHVPALHGFPNPTIKLLAGRLLSRGACRLRDVDGATEPIGWWRVLRAATRYMADLAGLASLPKQLQNEVKSWPEATRRDVAIGNGQPIVIRTDLSYDLKAGGLISHLIGFLEGLIATGQRPRLLTAIPMNEEASTAEFVRAPWIERYWDFPGLPNMAVNDALFATGQQTCDVIPVSFVYQRNIAFATSGFRLARAQNVPFVLEYNGSEVWMNRNWGRPLPHEELAEQIETANLRAADLVVVVSLALKNELVARNVDAKKIVVAPCAVNPDRFHPGIDGADVRTRLHWEDAVVIGFIGTFGRWHGADVLASAFSSLPHEEFDRAKPVRLILVGDGETRPEAERILEEKGYLDIVHLTGQVAPDSVPTLLAACDILVSPQTENPDGSQFFGSPVKLFEYMAMGRAIVASDLGQIGDVIEHEQTGILVSPGRPEDLAEAIASLVRDEDMRQRLGANARAAAVEQHSWDRHARTILDRLEERCG